MKAEGLFLGVWALLLASTAEDGGGPVESFAVVKRTMEGALLGDYGARLRVCRTAVEAIGEKARVMGECADGYRLRDAYAVAAGAGESKLCNIV